MNICALMAILPAVLATHWKPESVRDRDWAKKHPANGAARLVDDTEPGQPLVVSGAVRDEAGQPISGAILYVFQADAQGHYTKTKVMDEPNARLFAYIKTRPDGSYSLETIRPGGYPLPPDRSGVEWEIPAHIHFEITADGHRQRRFQLVFDDDPRMQPEHWKKWARDGGHPVATVTEQEDGPARCTCDIQLRSR